MGCGSSAPQPASQPQQGKEIPRLEVVIEQSKELAQVLQPQEAPQEEASKLCNEKQEETSSVSIKFSKPTEDELPVNEVKQVRASVEFSFNNSPQNDSTFMLKFNQPRRKVGQLYTNSQGGRRSISVTGKRRDTQPEWREQKLGILRPSDLVTVLVQNDGQSWPFDDATRRVQSSDRQQPMYCVPVIEASILLQIEKPVNAKINLLETLRNRRQNEEIQPAAPTQKVNLLDLVRQQQSNVLKQSITILPEDDSTPQSAIQLRQRLRQYYEAQGGSSTLSPIYAIDSGKTKDKEESEILNFQLQPIPIARSNPTSTLHAKQTLLAESPSLQQSFLLQDEESRLDLEKYTLKVENMEVNYLNQTQVLGSGSMVLGSELQKGATLQPSPFRISVDLLSQDKNFQLLTPDHNQQSMNQSQQLPPTPTYPMQSQWKESEIQTERAEEPKSNRLALNLTEIRHPSFSQLEGTVKPLDSSRSADVQKQYHLYPKTEQRVPRRFSGTHHIPVETSIMERSQDQQGNKQINNYVIMHELGRGGFGKVRLVYCRTRNKYFVIDEYDRQAMKIANKSKLKKKLLSRQKSAYTLLEQEIATLKKLDHPNTVKLYEVIDDPAEDKLYLIIEFMEKGSIGSKSYWKEEGFDADAPKPSLPAERLRKYIREFLMGLDYLHNFALIFHRDIKPDNLLIDQNDTLKIADFGVAQMIEGNEEEIMGDMGTKTFLPPEHFLGKQVKGRLADIWASGITFYMLAFGSPPFKGKTLDQLKQSVINDRLTFPDDTHPGLEQFLVACLEKDPYRRPNLDQLMEHGWITQDGQDPLLQEEFDERLNTTELDVRHAITRMTITGTVQMYAKLKHHLNQSRARIKSRTIMQKL